MAKADYKKEISRLRSEVRDLKNSLTSTKKDISPFTGVVSGNYWTQTGMPWIESDGRKAVMTEWFWQPIRGQPRRVDTNELRQFSQTFWVSSCVNTLIDEITSLDWDIVPEDEATYNQFESEITALKEWLAFPNKDQESWTEIQRALVKDLLEIDAAVLVKVFDIESYDWDLLEPKSGAPTLKPRGQRTLLEVNCRDGASFLKEADKFGHVNGYWQYSYQIPAHPMWFNREEICYISERTRSMSVYGFSRTQAVLDIIKSLHYSTLYNKRYFEETAIPDGLLGLEDTNETEMKAFMDYWNGEFRAQPHKMGVVNKKINWTPFNISNKELEFLETQKSYYTWVISQFGLTPTELGITDDANRATGASQAEVAKRKGIRPILKLLEKKITKEIIKEKTDSPLTYQYIYDDPAEKKARLDNWKIELDSGLKTPNEVRNEMGLTPIEGGDTTNHQREQANNDANRQADAAKNGMSGEEQAHNPGYKEQINREENKSEKAYDNKTNMGVRVPGGNIVPIGQYYNPDQPLPVSKPQHMPIQNVRARNENNQDINQITRDQGRCPECGKETLHPIAEPDSTPYAGPNYQCTNCGFVTEYTEQTANDVLTTLSTTMMGNPAGKSAVNMTLKKSDSHMDFKEFVGFDYTKSLSSGIEYLESREYFELLKGYLDDLTDAQVISIIRVLKMGIMQGHAVYKISKAIDQILHDPIRSDMIARTETIRTVNEGNRIEMEKAGVTGVEWISAPEDGRLCNVCKNLDGKRFTIDKIKSMHPAHPRCRCTYAGHS